MLSSSTCWEGLAQTRKYPMQACGPYLGRQFALPLSTQMFPVRLCHVSGFVCGLGGSFTSVFAFGSSLGRSRPFVGCDRSGEV
jgi:hypothetical protein